MRDSAEYQPKHAASPERKSYLETIAERGYYGGAGFRTDEQSPRLEYVEDDEPKGLDNFFPGFVYHAGLPGYPEHEREKVPRHAAKQSGFFDKIKSAWYAAGAAVGSYFSDPEKGRRRKALAVIGALAVAGTAALLIGHDFGDRAGNNATPPTPAPPETPQPEPEPPTVTPEPPEPPTEPPDQPPKQPEDKKPDYPHYDDHPADTDGEMPEPYGYHGQPYEWSIAADLSSPENATPMLMEMIENARARGVQVETWGDTCSGYWGITSVTVDTAEGCETYYDTPSKMAVLQGRY